MLMMLAISDGWPLVRPGDRVSENLRRKLSSGRRYWRKMANEISIRPSDALEHLLHVLLRRLCGDWTRRGMSIPFLPVATIHTNCYLDSSRCKGQSRNFGLLHPT